ncbi:MAG: outer membrane protein assembly factor BamA [Xanthomonadales bacterium]|nr:outer membrane protein assembly factor BamA [Gammaproteobacteria bacterium]MBT8054583.1 outer membrane protein assembly factor BamA [Gammaproteobacteria bacterium]NND55615.1 outer membrane protein assembly factor BamA [Xanthomonadales bacterium]NNK50516.1 outer membrane protein assembly factor BamA [Xanthomonadales bacterium]
MTLILSCLLWANAAQAAYSFTISDIRVEGLQRIAEGTIYNYLPLNPGDQMTPAAARSAIRELYRTGFFQDISLNREGDILVITVKERPAISNVSLSGNKAIKEEELRRVLLDIGLSEGEVFDRLVLDRLKQELIKQYFSQGRYAVSVDTRVTDLDRNRVRIAIVIDEGDVAEIRHINIVGNETFSDKEIRKDFEADIKPFWKFWSKEGQYSREKLSGDIEKLRSYYLDRGYVDFSVESTQVAIGPEKQDIYITANVVEGDVYGVDEVSITGDLVIDEGTIRRLIITQPGEIFSRKKIEQSVENISAVLSNIGYAFANVNPITDVDRDNRLVSINFFVDPGKRVYIRRIQFVGNSKTKDEVLRREMRQMEGAWFSQSAIDRSKIRMQRLTYFEQVEIETPAVPGTDDQVDVVVTVQERPAGSFTVGLGYSQVQGLIASLSIQQENFIGSGKRLGLGISHSKIISSLNITYDNPYWTDDGVSRGFYVRYQEFDQGQANISTFTSSEWAVGMNFGVPVTEVDYIRSGAGYRNSQLNIGSFQCVDFDPDEVICNEFGLVPSPGDPLSASLDFNGDGVISVKERQFDVFDWSVSWTRDSRNHFLNPSRGSAQSLTFQAALPGSSREYYKVLYRGAKYWPIWGGLVFSVRGNLGYGDSYDSYDKNSLAAPVEADAPVGTCDPTDFVKLDTGLPFYEHFYSGGVRDLRGYDDNTLGPKDAFCRSVGGDFKVAGGVELAFPTPFVGSQSGTRIALFVDTGYVYENIQAFEASKLRGSFGLSVTWEAPIGPIVISYAFPFNDQPGDRTEDLQFSFGTTF